jgi:stress-induced morphogen
MSIDANFIREKLQKALPDADIRLEDTRGDGSYYSAHIVSIKFRGLSRVEQHRLVYDILRDYMDGDVHALQLKTEPKR